MSTPHGSVAAARRSRRAVPESTENRRALIRAHLLERAPTLQYLAAAVGYRLSAPDTESALVYLRELRDLCDESLAPFDG
jgi:hypothetical protein